MSPPPKRKAARAKASTAGSSSSACRPKEPSADAKKRISTKKAKGEPKPKRARLEPEPKPTPARAEQTADANPIDEDTIEPVECDEEHYDESEESTISIPWNNVNSGGAGGKPVITTAFDEIALEGLDGITLEALWTRLALSLSIPRPLSRNLMDFVWKNVKTNEEVQFYQLDVPRGMLHLSTDDDPGAEIYPFAPINDVPNNVIGSCSTYNARTPIDAQVLTLTQAEALGNVLVAVASQALRTNALVEPLVDPRLLNPQKALIPMQYYILESIGRCRRRGITTNGARSLASILKDPKKLFYYRNSLQRMGLITKQTFHWRTQNASSVGGLVHLQRFYNEVKSKKQVVIEFIVKLLKQKPSCRIEYLELRRAVGRSAWDSYQVSKVIKSAEFRQFVKTDVVVPYRLMYPDAPVTEWRHKAKDAEKSVRVLELMNPNINLNFLSKEDKEEDGKDSSDSEPESDVSIGDMATRRTYLTICAAGAQGITMRALSARANCDHHTTRNICKNLTARGLIISSMQDSKRQHFMLYIAAEYASEDGVKADDVEIDADCTPVDDDVYDFIGNVLNTDPKLLKRKAPPKSEAMELCPTPSAYSIVQSLRKAKDNDSLKVYFSNEHPFEAVELVPLKCDEDNAITQSEATKRLFSTLMEATKPTSSFVPVCQYDITAKHSGAEKTKPSVHSRPRRRTLKSFKPFMCLINPRFAPKSLEYYARKCSADVRDDLSSSNDELLEDDKRSSESIASGLTATHKPRAPVSDDVKAAIIENFELLGSRLGDKLQGASVSGPATASAEEPAAEGSGRENQSSFCNVYMDLFMGPKPRVLSVSTDSQHVETTLVSSTHPADFTRWRPLLSNSQRVQSRIQLIKATVSSQKSVVDLIKIQSVIYQTERAEGYTAKVDRRSLQRILTTLVKEGEFTITKIILRHGNIVRTKNVISEPTADVETLIQSVVDQFKNSFLMYAKRKIYEQQEQGGDDAPNKARRHFKCNRFVGKLYGLAPKIAKMRALHEFLFYITRDYTGSAIAHAESREMLLRHCGVESIDAVMSEATTLYQRDISWRMFVPPLPQHKPWTAGWALISDILLRLPLSIFVKLFNIRYVIPELPSYLNHPVRKHFIVRNMPSHIKDALHGYRKYIFTIHEVICYLCYIGLVQFGPQRLREKDQVFIYLNAKGAFHDTTTSEKGYHHVTKKEYPKLVYEFRTPVDVERYWSEMYYYASNTKLGNRGAVVGQSIKLEYVHGKPLLIATRRSQTMESAAKNDVGYIPGDGLGACCSDSALWLHSQRNWSWYSRQRKGASSSYDYVTGMRKRHLEQVKQVKVGDTQCHRRGVKVKVLKRRDAANLARMRKAAPRTLKKKVIMRKVNPRKATRRKPVRVDHIDQKISEAMGKARAIFTPEEDKLILVCMACGDYLTAFNRNRSVASAAMRDFIHRTMPHSRKTSLAYRRRAFKLRGQVNLEDKKDGWIVKMIADFFTEKHFAKFRHKLKRGSMRVVTDADINIAFLYLCSYAWKRYQSKGGSHANKDNEALKDYLKPETVERFEVKPEVDDDIWRDPANENEVQLDTIQSVVHSSLSGQRNDEQWRHQLLNVYQTFSENLIRTALTNMRDYQIIAGRRAKCDKEGTILMSGITYNLSFNYTFKQITQFPHCIFTDAHAFLMAMFRRPKSVNVEGLHFDKFEHGLGLGLGELQTQYDITWAFDLPDDVITLNPNMSDFSELITELTQRYTELMKKCQESDEYDPEAIQQMKITLQSCIQDQARLSPPSSAEQPRPGLPSSSTVDVAASAAAVAACAGGSNSESRCQDTAGEVAGRPAIVEGYGKADRRHKTWRISDIAFMLTKGLFPELDDDDRLEKLNEHFIVRYPNCRIQFDEALRADNVLVNDWPRGIRVTGEDIIKTTLDNALIPNVHMDQKAHNLEPEVEELANFIYGQHSLGASPKDIKKKFPGIDVQILERLIDIGLVIRVGVCNRSFVHHNFRHYWSIYVKTERSPTDKAAGGWRALISPWIRINGTIDGEVLEKWMSIILSYCLSYPCMTFNRLSTRFNVIKPVDVYYILEVLQRLQCLRIWTYVRDDGGQDIFSDFDVVPQVPSSMLDDFDDVFVETESLAITKFGAFLNRHKTDFAYAFKEEE